MSNFTVKLNTSGVRELLKSKELQDGLDEIARGIAGRAGDGYASDTKQMPTRVIASAYTDTRKAYFNNLKDNTLLKAVK